MLPNLEVNRTETSSSVSLPWINDLLLWIHAYPESQIQIHTNFLVRTVIFQLLL
jgi:hypothetical protein